MTHDYAGLAKKLRGRGIAKDYYTNVDHDELDTILSALDRAAASGGGELVRNAKDTAGKLSYLTSVCGQTVNASDRYAIDKAAELLIVLADRIAELEAREAILSPIVVTAIDDLEFLHRELSAFAPGSYRATGTVARLRATLSRQKGTKT
jgi:hypothetical protein